MAGERVTAPISPWVKTILFSFDSVSIYDIKIMYRMIKMKIFKIIHFRELVAQLVRVSVSELCRAGRLRFEPQSTLNILSVPFTLNCMNSLSLFIIFPLIPMKTC